MIVGGQNGRSLGLLSVVAVAPCGQCGRFSPAHWQDLYDYVTRSHIGRGNGCTQERSAQRSFISCTIIDIGVRGDRGNRGKI